MNKESPQSTPPGVRASAGHRTFTRLSTNAASAGPRDSYVRGALRALGPASGAVTVGGGHGTGAFVRWMSVLAHPARLAATPTRAAAGTAPATETICWRKTRL